RNYFEDFAKIAIDKEKIKLGINYITSDIAGLVKKSGIETIKMDGAIRVSVKIFSEIVDMLKAGELSSRGAKDIINLFWQDDKTEVVREKTARQIAEDNGFIIKNDPEALKKMIVEVIDANPTVLESYKAGKEASLQFFVGQIMKLSKGSVNPAVAKEEILKIIASM
ncbi:MAG: aspartyl-tRNA(Asn)/glutamyl-tRNA(Gln) amidotransferase subunit, partial [Patescibacteria group bacterium]|nr:aspartyl-tRNA(Asn)/glutamyl-tRNA(Gln) amidotransferase subunit [Patescibacteria group bacterium]